MCADWRSGAPVSPQCTGAEQMQKWLSIFDGGTMVAECHSSAPVTREWQGVTAFGGLAGQLHTVCETVQHCSCDTMVARHV
eukprot:scaffold140162_cov18-Tisochrysis_lutea.AAC.3